MTSTDVERAGRFTLHELGLSVEAELGFNECRALVRDLVRTTGRGLWSLGDLWIYMNDRFGKDYHAGLRELEEESRLILIGARVARGFPLERRRGQLTFEIHAVVAGEDPADQERWLDEVERHDWNRQQLAFAFAEAMPSQPVAAISARVTGSLHELLVAEADRRDMEPKALHAVALEKGLRLLAAENLSLGAVA